MKPNSGGIAAMEAAATTVEANVNGILLYNLPKRRMSREPASWSTTPISMNSEDLNSACASVCVSAAASASGVPMPMAATIQPRWLTVEYAVRCFKSVLVMANVALISAVNRPMDVKITFHVGWSAKMVEKRSSR